MKNIYFLFVSLLVIALLVTGCASTEKTETLDNLGDLGELGIKIETDAPIVGARDKAMDSYWEYMAGTKEKTQKIEALRRLADLEMERSEERFQKQMEVYSQGQKGDEIDVQALKDNTYRGAIKLYEDALKISGHGTQNVALLYQLSKAYETAGQPKKALLALTNLLAASPDASNRDELYFRRGELMFDLRQFKKAAISYSQVMKTSPGSVYYEKALTKRGWSLYRESKYQQALGSFLALLNRKLRNVSKIPESGKTKLSRGDEELVGDVFRAVILSFNEIGGSAAVKQHFEDAGHQQYEIRIYRQLAEFYVDKGRAKDAADTYAAFPEVYPLDANAYVFDLKAIETYASAGFASLLIELKEDFIKRYRINGRYWKHFQEQENSVLANLKVALTKNTEEVVKHYHAAAQKSKDLENYQRAFLMYRQYLKWFGQSRNAQKLNFLYAELLFEARRFESAAKEYEKTAYQYRRFGDNAEAGYASILAYTELEKKSQGKKKEGWSRMVVGSALRFGKKFPGDKRAPGVLTKAAQDMFALKKYGQASVAARQILELSVGRNSSSRRIAWNIIARSEFEKGDYARSEVSFKIAISLLPKKDKNRKTLAEGLAAAVYKQGEYLRSKGKYQAAIAQFSRVSKVSPGSPFVVTAKFDIATSLLAAKDWSTAARKFSGFRKSYPNHPLTKKIPDNLVIAYLKTNQHAKAAHELEAISKTKKSPADKSAVLWQAIELYEKAGTGKQLLASLKSFVGKFPSPMERATEARQKIADIYLKKGSVKNRHHWLREIMENDKSNQSESTARTRYLSAKASLELAQPAMKSFQIVKLVKPLKKNLKRKKQKMKIAVEAFTIAADYGIAEVSTASVYWLAEIYNEFGRELMKSERPGGLSGEELEQYDILLEEQAYPFEEKSINIHETNIGRIADGVYDEWVKKSLSKLKDLSPVRYSKSEVGEPDANFIYY
jgi:tetratricopeptide (TPR) repeat protein